MEEGRGWKWSGVEWDRKESGVEVKVCQGVCIFACLSVCVCMCVSAAGRGGGGRKEGCVSVYCCLFLLSLIYPYFYVSIMLCNSYLMCYVTKLVFVSFRL